MLQYLLTFDWRTQEELVYWFEQWMAKKRQ